MKYILFAFLLIIVGFIGIVATMVFSYFLGKVCKYTYYIFCKRFDKTVHYRYPDKGVLNLKDFIEIETKDLDTGEMIVEALIVLLGLIVSAVFGALVIAVLF